jgi:hypothetical protein
MNIEQGNRIKNIEKGMMKAEVEDSNTSSFIIPCSMFNI